MFLKERVSEQTTERKRLAPWGKQRALMEVGISAEGSKQFIPRYRVELVSRQDRQGSSVATIPDARGVCNKRLGGVAGILRDGRPNEQTPALIAK